MAEVATWEAKDLTARLELLTNMEDTQKQAMQALTTANAMWERLKQTYDQKDVVSQIANLKTIMNTSCSEDQDIPKYV